MSRHALSRWLFAGAVLAAMTTTACVTAAQGQSGRERSHAIDDRLKTMSLDEKIGQMFVPAGRGVFMNERSAKYRRLLQEVEQNHAGGIIWFLSNIYETAWLNRQLQLAAEIPLLITADLEAGLGMRFEDTTFWPWAMALAATGDPALAHREGAAIAREALAVGINQIYAPVADVNNNPDNPVINVRSFGEDPRSVARFITAFIRGVQSEGVLATAKHFPGHGDTRVDSHRALPVLDATPEHMSEMELVPFRAAIEAGVGSIMIGHLSVPALDPSPAPTRRDDSGETIYTATEAEETGRATTPASLSKPIVTGLLRQKLGFKGLVVTDAFEMRGITSRYDAATAAVLAIDAGVDQILMSADSSLAIAGVRRAIVEGRLSEKRIDESVRRILSAKAFVRTTVPDLSHVFRGVDMPENAELAQEIASKALTLVREEGDRLPLRRDARVTELVISDFVEDRPPLLELHRQLESRLAEAPIRVTLDRRSTIEEADRAYAAAKDADAVVIASAVRIRSGEGHVALPDLAQKLISRLERVPSGPTLITVSFGDPYLLTQIPGMPTYIAAYGIQPVMQIAAARALFGEAPFTGHLPVTLPNLYPLGHGIEKPAVAGGEARKPAGGDEPAPKP